MNRFDPAPYPTRSKFLVTSTVLGGRINQIQNTDTVFGSCAKKYSFITNKKWKLQNYVRRVLNPCLAVAHNALDREETPVQCELKRDFAPSPCYKQKSQALKLPTTNCYWTKGTFWLRYSTTTNDHFQRTDSPFLYASVQGSILNAFTFPRWIHRLKIKLPVDACSCEPR